MRGLPKVQPLQPLLFPRTCFCWGLPCLTFAVINVGAALEWEGKAQMELEAEFCL